MRARGGRGFLLPGLLFLFAIDLVPLVYSAWLSLYDWWLLRPRNIQFIGLGNYVRLATDPAFATRTGEFISSTPLAGLLPTIPSVRDRALRRSLWETTEQLLDDQGRTS